MARRGERRAHLVLAAVVIVGCGGAHSAVVLEAPRAKAEVLAVSPATPTPSKAARLTPGDMLASRAMQGAPFYVIHDEGPMLACRRWTFADGQIAGDDTVATMGEATGAPRKIRIDAEASTAVVGGATGTATVRYTITAEDDGLALWLATDRSERRKLFHSFEACQAAAKREEKRAHEPPAADGDDDEPHDRPGPPGPR